MKMDEIITAIKKCVDDWLSKKHIGCFSWVDDGLGAYIKIKDFNYFFHILWIKDWNESNREIPMAEFVIAWTTEENVRQVCAAINKWNS